MAIQCFLFVVGTMNWLKIIQPGDSILVRLYFDVCHPACVQGGSGRQAKRCRKPEAHGCSYACLWFI